MTAPSKSHISLLIAIGLFFGLGMFAMAHDNGSTAVKTFLISLLLGFLIILILYLTSLRNWRRAAGWYGAQAQQRQWAGASVNSKALGKFSALGATLGPLLLFAILLAIGVSEGAILAALTGVVSSFMVGLGLLWIYLLWRARLFCSKEYDVTDAHDV